ncbi:MAG TPA: helix-turn-helix domain-containing protein [Micromonosporaceae bacterium]|nr:helix-turn-helix domain-containing protein [Micromonosporaceae bacterium]
MARRRLNPDTSIGERIAQRRQLRGWSIRYAASRAGLDPSTWSRIERGITSADNRFVLAEIAAALECSTAELAGVPAGSADPEVAAALAGVGQVREALIDAELDEPATCAARPLPELGRLADTEQAVRLRCDYAGALRLLPDLIRGLHALTHGPDREPALRLLVQVAYDAFVCLSSVGYVAESWMAARLGHQAADAVEDPTLRGFSGFTLSRAAVACGSYRRALHLADRHAVEMDEHTDQAGALEMLGMLHLAGAYAARGLRQDATTHLTEAGQLAGRTGETDTHCLYFGPTNVRIWRVSMDTDGGDPGQAVAIARTTNPLLIPVAARQSLFYIDTGRALARLGRSKEAARMLLIGERTAPQRVRASRFVRETVRALSARPGAELHGLAERVGVA